MLHTGMMAMRSVSPSCEPSRALPLPLHATVMAWPGAPAVPRSPCARRSLNAANWQWLSASTFFNQYFRVYSPIS